jgi:hypothetical protein
MKRSRHGEADTDPPRTGNRHPSIAATRFLGFIIEFLDNRITLQYVFSGDFIHSGAGTMTRRERALRGRAMMKNRREILKGDLPSERDAAMGGGMSPRDQPVVCNQGAYVQAIADLLCAAEWDGFSPSTTLVIAEGIINEEPKS